MVKKLMIDEILALTEIVSHTPMSVRSFIAITLLANECDRAGLTWRDVIKKESRQKN